MLINDCQTMHSTECIVLSDARNVELKLQAGVLAQAQTSYKRQTACASDVPIGDAPEQDGDQVQKRRAILRGPPKRYTVVGRLCCCSRRR